MKDIQVFCGEAGSVLASLGSDSVGALVTDPPAGVGFMGAKWDTFDGKEVGQLQSEAMQTSSTSYHKVRSKAISQQRRAKLGFKSFIQSIAVECYRVMKPGAHGFVWALPRTSHWTADALEEAGFEVRDVIDHVFMTGFPKALDVSNAIDIEIGCERPLVVAEGRPRNPKSINGGEGVEGGDRPWMKKAREVGYHMVSSKEPVSEEAKKWNGWRTALKPSHENWILIRKPLSESSVAKNVLRWGTGALNIDDNTIGDELCGWGGGSGFKNNMNASLYGGMKAGAGNEREGRWPSNTVFSHLSCESGECSDNCLLAGFDAVTGGLASKFFFCPKPGRSEKDLGLADCKDRSLQRVNPGGLEHDPRWAKVSCKNNHETVKPVTLMRHLCRLVTPIGGVVLDPFMGSGTTGVAAVLDGFKFIGIEMRKEHCDNAEKRIEFASKNPEAFNFTLKKFKKTKKKKEKKSEAHQMEMADVAGS